MGRRGARDEGAIGECARGEYTGRAGCWSKVSYLLLLLPVVRLVRALRPRKIHELAATVAQMVGGNVGSTARASECYAAQVRTACAASK